MKFSHSFLVQGDDIDEHEHVNNVAYLRWIQEVAVAHWRDAARPEIQKQFTWFVLRHEIDYKNRAFEGDRITASTWVGKATKIKCERFNKIKRNEEILAEARSVWCLLDTESGRPSRISDDLRQLFGMI
ncbi:MAG: acyl-CoA thioesterase [Pyrinomonadaceae bacterium]|nr:acyl-CoA thioesterase [Pyrinomonadaceae bacterium]